MPWLVGDVAFPAACIPLSAGTSRPVLSLSTPAPRLTGRAQLCFPPPLPVFQPVFVYQGITAVTLQSSNAPVGEKSGAGPPPVRKPARNKWRDVLFLHRPEAGNPAASPLEGKSGRGCWGCGAGGLGRHPALSVGWLQFVTGTACEANLFPP